MKRKIIAILLALTLIVAVTTTAALAAQQDTPANDKAQSGKSNVGHLYLYEKDADWDIVWGGAWGKLTHNLSGEELCVVFNGHGLEAGQEYALVVGEWPMDTVFGTATADEYGNVHIANCLDLAADYTNDAGPEDVNGLKIWLVTTDSGWNPADYLFEHNVIAFDDTGV